MNYKNVYIILGICLLISVFAGSTFAWLSWKTATNQQTKIGFGIPESLDCSADGGGDITNNDVSLVPTTCNNSNYVIKREIKVDVVFDDDTNGYASLDLWLDINDLGSGLSQSDNFMWMLSTSSDGCNGDGIVSYGNFNGLTVEGKVHLIDEKVYTSSLTNDTYYLYIWLDRDQKTTETMEQTFQLSLNGSCSLISKGDPFYAIYSEDDASLRFYKENEGVIVEGQQYEGRTATNVYKAYENDNYMYDSTTEKITSPWDEVRNVVTSVVFEDEISPISTKNWFNRFLLASHFDVTNLNTSNVDNMENMFREAGYNASSFSIVGLNNWNVSNVKNMYGMFGYSGVNSTTYNIGDLSGWDTSNVITMRTMFYETGKNATTYNIGNLNNWDVSNVFTMRTMFYSAGKSATSVNIGNLSSWNVSNVKDISSMFYEFGYNTSTFNIGNLNNWDVSNVTEMKSMFAYTGYKASSWNIGDLSSWNVSNVSDIHEMFNRAGFFALTFDIGNLNNWNVSNVIDMSGMFKAIGYNSSSVNIGDLSSWNVSKVTDMNDMFKNAGYYASSFNIGNISGWNTVNVTNMNSMFANAGYSATNLSLDLSSWNVNKVTDYTDFNANVSSKIIAPNWIN